MERTGRVTGHAADSAMSMTPVRGAVRRALHVRGRSVGAGVLAAGLAAATPAALAAPFPPVFELSSLFPDGGGDGSEGFVLTGTNAIAQLGSRCPGARCVHAAPEARILASRSSASLVSVAGDINGDGIDDFIVGAPRANPDGQAYAGTSYVVFGSTQGFPAVFQLESLYPGGGGDGTQGFLLVGIDPGDYSGWSVSAAGDVNGDSVDDLIIGAPLAEGAAGQSYVVFGRQSGFSAVFQLASLLPPGGGDGSTGFALTGIDANDQSGFSVSGAGDVNGDGVDDVIIGAYMGDPNGRTDAGESYVVFGSTQAFPAVLQLASLLPANGGDGSVGVILAGPEASKHSGLAVSGAGDVNGDGTDDVIVGTPRADGGGTPYSGESYVVFGSAQGFPAAVQLASLLPDNGGDGSAGFVLEGIAEFDHEGVAASAAGDVNGDGIDDVIVGAARADRDGQSRKGESYVVFGSTQGFPAALPLASLLAANGGDGSVGVVLTGAEEFELSGCSVSAAGDVNGDGVDDLIIGAYGADPGGQPYTGESYVVFGSSEGFPAELPLASLFPTGGGDGSAGFVLTGIAELDFAGRSVSAAGDVNGDGTDDVIIDAPYADVYGHSGAGEGYVVFGRTDSDSDSDGIADDLDNCVLVSNADQRDTNGDGYGNVCDPDLTNDGIVNFSDLGLLKGVFFSTDPDADFNGDGAVNFVDLGTMNAFFFLPPGPSGLVEVTSGGPPRLHRVGPGMPTGSK